MPVSDDEYRRNVEKALRKHEENIRRNRVEAEKAARKKAEKLRRKKK